MFVSNSKKVQRNVTKFWNVLQSCNVTKFANATMLQSLAYTITKFNGGHFFLTNSNTKTHSSFISLTTYSVQFIQFDNGSVTHDPGTFCYSCNFSVNHR